jgi:hypothetical protein
MVGGVLLGLGLVFVVGCDKSGTTSAGGGKGGDELYSKKLVGVWEGKEEGKGGDKDETITVEFKADGGFKVAMGPFDLVGTWKLVKEDGKTVTVDTEVTFPGFGDEKAKGKSDKKTLSVVFEDANTVVMSKVGEKPDPLKLKRKS